MFLGLYQATHGPDLDHIGETISTFQEVPWQQILH